MDIKIDVYKNTLYIMVNRTLLDLAFRIVIIMVSAIGYEIGSHLDGALETIVLFGTGFIASFLIGLYGELYDKYFNF
jgi:hypothetical protein